MSDSQFESGELTECNGRVEEVSVVDITLGSYNCIQRWLNSSSSWRTRSEARRLESMWASRCRQHAVVQLQVRLKSQ